MALILGALVTSCGGDDDDAGSEGTGTDETTTVRFALDWTPNTNHTGLYVADELGYFEEAGIDVEILPFAETPADTLVGTGSAEFGVSFQDSLVFSRASGMPVISVLAVLQHWGTEIAVRADRDDITSPADLDGKVYAGFGLPYEIPVLEQVIKNDGGKGTFETVTLQTAAYEALYSGDVDFTVPFVAWEGIEAELRGEPLKTFNYTDYGFPDMYQVVIAGNEDWLAEHPDEAKAFVQALQRGYEYAVENPEEAAQILIDANPDAFSEPELPVQSQELLSEQYMLDDEGNFGVQQVEQWTDYSRFLFEAGVLTDADGNPLADEPDYAALFTNDYLEG